MYTWPQGVDRRILETVDSTNAEAVRIAPDLQRPTWILGLRQTAGKGRRGRQWVDPLGNFAGTLVFRPDGPVEQVALRSFVASLALRDALVSLTGREDIFKLKWPNDVLLKGGKLAGILLESAGIGRGVTHLAIGIGVNLTTSPPMQGLEANAVRPVNLRQETGTHVTPEALLDALAPAYARWEAQLTTFGFGPIRNAWMQNAARLGEVITARTGKSSITGTFTEVDEKGALVLKAADGTHHIPAADIFFE